MKTMGFFDHYIAVFDAFFRLRPLVQLAALGVCFAAGPCLVFLHECGHLLAARTFGIGARIAFFPRKGKTKVWLLSVLGVAFDDRAFNGLPMWKRRFIAAAGPLTDLPFATVFFVFGTAMPGPIWLSTGLTVLGALYLFPCALPGIIPIKAARNDGWLVVFPRDAI
jgi:membrane-associated protease RseP (regulator of RpoE activity)